MQKFYILSTKYNIQTRKTKNNGTVYDVVFRIIDGITGKTIQKKLSGYQSKFLAKAAYAEFTRDNCELVRSNPFKQTQPEKRTLTVNELFAEYMGTQGAVNKSSTVYEKRHIFDAHILPELGEMKMTDLTAEALYKWQDALWNKTSPRTNERYSFAYLKKVRMFLSRFLTRAEERYKYPNNFKTVKIPRQKKEIKEQSDGERIWTREQFERFSAVIDDDLYKSFFTVLFYTGRRIGEVCALSPKDVTESTIRINKNVTKKTTNGQPWEIVPTKAYKDDTLPLCPRAVRAFDEYRKTEYYDGDAEFLFGGDRPLDFNTISRRYKKYLALSGNPPIRIHDFRHSFVSLLIHNGANLTVVASLISDTLEQVTKTYAHLYETDRQTVLNSIK